MPKSIKARGFTLVELMVAISILAILAIIGLVIYTGQEKAALLTKVQQDFQAMSKQIQLSKQVNNNSLCIITGPYSENGNCVTDGACRIVSGSYPVDMKVKDRTGICLDGLKRNWEKVTGKPYDEIPLIIDPWGNPYTFDENEDEPFFNWPPGAPNTYCRWDQLRTAGMDGLLWNEDDYYYFVPPYRCTIFEFPEESVTPGTRIY